MTTNQGTAPFRSRGIMLSRLRHGAPRRHGWTLRGTAGSTWRSSVPLDLDRRILPQPLTDPLLETDPTSTLPAPASTSAASRSAPPSRPCHTPAPSAAPPLPTSASQPSNHLRSTRKHDRVAMTGRNRRPSGWPAKASPRGRPAGTSAQRLTASHRPLFLPEVDTGRLTRPVPGLPRDRYGDQTCAPRPASGELQGRSDRSRETSRRMKAGPPISSAATA